MTKFEEMVWNHEDIGELPEAIKEIYGEIGYKSIRIDNIWHSYEDYAKAYIEDFDEIALSSDQEREFERYMDYEQYGRDLVACRYANFAMTYNGVLYIIEGYEDEY